MNTRQELLCGVVFHARFSCLSLPLLSCFCGYRNVWRQSGEQALSLAALWLPGALPAATASLTLLCYSWHVMLWEAWRREAALTPNLAFQKFRSKSKPSSLSGRRNSPGWLCWGHCKSASRRSDKMQATAVVGHVIVIRCGWFLIVSDLMPRTCMLHWKWQLAFFVKLSLRA